MVCDGGEERCPPSEKFLSSPVGQSCTIYIVLCQKCPIYFPIGIPIVFPIGFPIGKHIGKAHCPIALMCDSPIELSTYSPMGLL